MTYAWTRLFNPAVGFAGAGHAHGENHRITMNGSSIVAAPHSVARFGLDNGMDQTVRLLRPLGWKA